jgi:hypothetical protein
MLVLDANILVRAVLGSRVLSLWRWYVEHVEFLAPDTAFEEARERLPEILERRRLPVAPALAILNLLRRGDLDHGSCGIVFWRKPPSIHCDHASIFHQVTGVYAQRSDEPSLRLGVRVGFANSIPTGLSGIQAIQPEEFRKQCQRRMAFSAQKK